MGDQRYPGLRPADLAEAVKANERHETRHCLAVDGEHVCVARDGHRPGKHEFHTWDRVMIHSDGRALMVKVRP